MENCTNLIDPILKNKFWKHGQKSVLADAANVSRTYLADVLSRKKNLSYQKAVSLEKASALVFKTPISWIDWVGNKVTDHPAFRERA